MAERGVAGRSVLVVEDEGMIAMAIDLLLHQAGGLLVGPFSRAEEALKVAKEAVIDIGLLDIQVADGQTFVVADALAARDIPFIFLTGYQADILPSRFGARPCLRKPFKAPTLLTTIERTMQNTR